MALETSCQRPTPAIFSAHCYWGVVAACRTSRCLTEMLDSMVRSADNRQIDPSGPTPTGSINKAGTNPGATDAMHEVLNTLTEAERAYRSGEPTMSDDEFDALRDGLEVEWESAGRPPGAVAEFLGIVAGGVESGDVPHSPAMLSLDKTTTEAGLAKFVGSLPQGSDLLVSPKLDGVAIALRFENGSLARAITRGTGKLGKDVTHNADMIQLPLMDQSGFTGEVRGEIVMTHDDLAVAAANRGEPLANRRNPIGPCLGRPAHLERDHEIPMRFVAYSIVGGDGPANRSIIDDLETLDALGFTTITNLDMKDDPSYATQIVSDAENAVCVVNDMAALRDPDLPLMCDGAVLTVVDKSVQTVLGAGTRTPKWAIAFKYPAERSEGILERIDIAVGKAGYVSYTAVLAEPGVPLAGTVVRRASVHNPSIVEGLGLRFGCRVVVSKRGDIIPQIESVVTDDAYDSLAPINLMQSPCPECAGVLNHDEVRPRCLNPQCAVAPRLAVSVSRTCLDIDGVGRSMIDSAIDAGVSDLADLFALDTDGWAMVEGVSSDRAPKLAEAFRDALTNRSLKQWLGALGVAHVHDSTALRLAEKLGSLDAVRTANEDDLAGVDLIGPIKAKAIYRGIQARAEILDRLVALGLDPTPVEKLEPISADTALSGQKVLVTGKLGISRSDAKKAVTLLGGTAASSPSKAVNVYVLGADAGPSKVAKAEGFVAEGHAWMMDPEEFEALAEAVLA